MLWTYAGTDDDEDQWKTYFKDFRGNISMKTNLNTKKMVINALLLALGALLHQITPALGFPMQPDMALAMLFIIIILNKEDYKSCLVASIITGIFTAMTTKFPGGQLPNLIDKVITMQFSYIIITIILKLNVIKKLTSSKKNIVLLYMILPIGTLISGTIFLGSAIILAGLPAPFSALFLTIVVPSTLLNTFAGIFLFKVISISLKISAVVR